MNHKTTAIIRYSALGVSALALSFVVATGCAKKSAQTTEPQALPVTLATAHRGNISERVALTGVVAAKQQANLSSVVTGQVRAVNVNVGDRVTAGTVLVRIDDSTTLAQLQQSEGSLAAARARLAQLQSGDIGASSSANANMDSARVAYQTAQANLRRNQQLFAQGYVSQTVVEQAQQALSAAQAQLRSAEVAAQNANLRGQGSSAQSEIRGQQATVQEMAGAVALAQAQLAQTVIAAPFNGVVTQRSVDPGTLAAPGTPLVQVSALDPAYVNIGIPEEDLPYIHVGTSVDITVDSFPGRVWHGTVNAVNSATSQGTLSYLARVTLSNDGLLLKAGMVANANFLKLQHRDVVLVPRAAVFSGEKGDAVYVLDKSSNCKGCNGKAKVVSVRRGLQTETETEVSGAGIAPGISVIVQRPDQLKDGSPVSVSSTGGQTQSSSQTLQ